MINKRPVIIALAMTSPNLVKAFLPAGRSVGPNKKRGGEDASSGVSDAGLKNLHEFLISDRAPEDCMGLSDLDGFLTAIAIGPEVIRPSEWLPVVWGDADPVFESTDDAQSVIGAIVGRYDEIVRLMQQDPDAYAPLFWQTRDGRVLAADWAEGFMEGVRLRGHAWRPLLESDEASELLTPIMTFLQDEDGRPLIDVEPDQLAKLRRVTTYLIVPSVEAINRYWKACETRTPRPLKTGRNDPYPYGSGREYKRCCGAN